MAFHRYIDYGWVENTDRGEWEKGMESRSWSIRRNAKYEERSDGGNRGMA